MVKTPKREKAGHNDLIKRIDELMATINKEMPSRNGDATITYLGKKEVPRTPTFTSGSWALDAALGGGYAEGRIIEIFGPEGGGKTTLVLHAIAAVQNKDPNALVAFIDAEHSLDLAYARSLGVNVETLMVSQPDSGEQALNVAKFLATHGAKLIVIDSAAALAPEIMFEKNIGEATVGVHAKLMSEGVRILNALLKNYQTTIIFTNQLRCMIGNGQQGFTTPGGRALRFYASQRVEVKRIGSDKHGEVAINNICVAKVAKNKVAPPFMKAQFKITFGRGIDPIEQIIDYGIKYKMIEKSGAWFVVKDKKYQGHKQLYEMLTTKPETMFEMQQAITVKLTEESVVETAANLYDAVPEDAAKMPTAGEAADVAEMMGLKDDEGDEE